MNHPKIPSSAHVSQAVRDANPALYNALTGVAPLPEPKLRKEKAMNKTEAAYAALLDAKMRKGEIVSWDYEGITLRIGRRRFIPDFTVVAAVVSPSDENQAAAIRIEFHETKGPYVREDASLKFDLFKSNYELFRFVMMQRIDGEWRQIR